MHLKNFNTQEHAVFIFPRSIYTVLIICTL